MLKKMAIGKLLERGWVPPIAPEEGIHALLRAMRPRTTSKQLLRIGGEMDGGYLVPDDLDGVRYCFSPGVADTSTFEVDLAARGIESFMADYSVGGPAVQSEMFHFEKRYLGARTDQIFTTLKDWIERSVPKDSGDLILQMDIEGSEYDVIFDTPEDVWKRFRIVVMEIHDLNAVFSPLGLRIVSLCMNKLLRIFDVVHIHPNNSQGAVKRRDLEIPNLLEVTFLRKDRIDESRFTGNFPHALDRRNVPELQDLVLPECWHS
jgi:hypothetical protein